MPTYNYYCSDCESHFSYFQKMSESPLSKCKKCGGEVKRIITGGTGLIFKGSGFYLTDYKNSQNSIKEHSKTDDDKQKKSEPVKNEKNKASIDKSKQIKEKKIDE